MPHLSPSIAADFVRGLLTGAERDEAIREIGSCAACRALVGGLAREVADIAESTSLHLIPKTREPLAPSEMHLAKGSTIGLYRVDGLLGQGGMGVVYRVTHMQLEKRFALKMLLPERAAQEHAVRRFVSEARALGSIGHEGVVDILDFGYQEDGAPFLVMEYLQGRTLEELLRTEACAPHDAFEIARRLAEALAAVHAVGVVHRDVKPANVFVAANLQDRGSVKLLDFGLAKLGANDDNDASLTRTGAVMGTPAYMPPEQWFDSKHVGASVDVYAWGVLTHQMLTGRIRSSRESMEGLHEELGAFPRRVVDVIASALTESVHQRIADGRFLCARWSDAMRILGPRVSDLAPAPSKLETPIVGREKDVAALVLRCDQKSGPVVLLGADGSGRSTLLHSVGNALRAKGLRVFERSAQGTDGAYAALRHLLPSSAKSTELELHRLFRQEPCVLLLDDIETLDAESAALLRVHRDSDCVWMLGATSHADVAVLWGEPWPMRGLDRASLETLVRATQTPLSDEVLEQLSERTQGHPLFFLQTLALLREGGDLSATLSVVEVVAARIERLAGSHAHAWKVASVLRDAFSTEDLAMLGVLDALSEVRYLRAHGVLELNASGGCVFVSDVFRRAAKSLLSHDQAALLHREAASLYARRSAPPWSRVAEHYLAAGDTLRASDAYAFAALGASAVPCSDLQHGGSRPEASFALRAKWSASALMHDSEGRADATELRLLQMDALESEGHFDQVLSAIAALDSSAWTSDQEARILVRQGTALQRMGKHEAALLVFHRAETTARENSDSADTVALALGRHAVCLALAGRLEEARDRLWEAEALVQQHAPQRRADLAGWRAQVAGLSGDLAARRDAYWTAVELFREAGNARFAAFSLLNLGDTYTRLGAYDEALPALARAHTECTILGATLMAGYASLNLGYVQAHLDQTEEAERRMDEAEATAERGGDARLLRYCLLYRARLHIEGDAPVRPYEALGRLLAESDDAQTDAAWRAMSLAVLARRALVLGETNEALRLAREAREVVVQADAIEEGEADVDVVLADALDAAGLADESNLTVQRAVRRIRDAAKRIAGAHWRTRFLQDVPAHRDLLSRVL